MTALLVISQVTAGAGTASRLGMADAMLNMMDAMGLLGGAEAQRRGAPGSSGLEPRAWSPGGMPWPDGWRPDGFQPGPLPAPALGQLQGIWISNTGEQLWLRGPRFRLQARAGRIAEGLLQLRSGRLAFYSPQLDRHWLFEYAEHEGRLALRDSQGRLFLFRRAEPRAGYAIPGP